MIGSWEFSANWIQLICFFVNTPNAWLVANQLARIIGCSPCRIIPWSWEHWWFFNQNPHNWTILVNIQNRIKSYITVTYSEVKCSCAPVGTSLHSLPLLPKKYTVLQCIRSQIFQTAFLQHFATHFFRSPKLCPKLISTSNGVPLLSGISTEYASETWAAQFTICVYQCFSSQQIPYVCKYTHICIYIIYLQYVYYTHWLGVYRVCRVKAGAHDLGSRGRPIPWILSVWRGLQFSIILPN